MTGDGNAMTILAVRMVGTRNCDGKSKTQKQAVDSSKETGCPDRIF